ncbi:MAG TPA: Gfo/Idh/MocA family oxidoreductase [Dermatophilaceae bacterium]|nr:Gfo/Idh/MocA family oxidoreductase [Dermatophilaceae bacterium]
MGSVRWGILSTANIARVLVEASRRVPNANFVAVASRDAPRATAFAEQTGLPAAYDSYDALLARDDVDAVYLPLPISMHAEWTQRALRAGKHVLCEKAFVPTAEDAAACFEVAEARGLVLAEALMWRLHPQTALVRRLVDDGAIGALRTVRAALSISAPPGDIRRRPELGGGATLDLGTYCVSALRLFGGSPTRVYAELLDYGSTAHDVVDMRLAGTLRLSGGVLGVFDIGLDTSRRDQLELVGSTGTIVVTDPWICSHKEILLTQDGATRAVPVDEDGSAGLLFDGLDPYAIELERVSAAVLGERELEFGRADAVEQATVLSALLRSGRSGRPVELSSAGAA